VHEAAELPAPPPGQRHRGDLAGDVGAREAVGAMSATIELTLIARQTKDGWVTVDPPEKKVARLIWASTDYFAMCVWRLYGRTLAERGRRP